MRRPLEIIIIAGPNGAGKTSFAREYLPPNQDQVVFVNADEIARRLARTGLKGRQLDIAAARRMIALMKQLTSSRKEMMLETTLATRAYARIIPQWRQAGYRVCLIYLRLPTVEASIARVQKRVANGGHSIPEADIRRRFRRSQVYLETIYKGLVDEWYVWRSLEGGFEMESAWDDK